MQARNIVTPVPEDGQLLSPTRAADLVGRWRTDPIDQWRQQQHRQQFIKPPQAFTHRLADEVQTLVREKLAALGYTTTPTGHKSPFDLWLTDTPPTHRALKIELKAANWTARSDDPRYGRFLANMKRNQVATADLVIFAVRNGRWHYFIIPAERIDCRVIAITSYDVEAYAGRWARYLEAWGLIGEALSRAPDHTRQLPLKM